MRILHIGDLHFSAKRIDEKRRCMSSIIGESARIEPDLFLNCGDTFDSSTKMEEPAALLAVESHSGLLDISPGIGLQGNYSHEKNSPQILPMVRGRYRMHYSMRPEIICFYGKEKALQISPFGPESLSLNFTGDPQAVFFTLPYPSTAFIAEMSRLNPEDMRHAVSVAITNVVRGYAALSVPAGIPKVLLFHGTITGCKYTETSTEIGMDIDLSPYDIGQCNFDATLAAHIHMCQKIETSSGPCFYPGGLACTSYNDDPHKGAWIHEFTTGEHGVALSSRHFDVGATPMKSIDVDFSDPFFEPPAVGVCDLQIKVKMLETDRERLKAMDWKQAFPDAVSIQIVPTVEQIGSVRCAEVRSAKSLRQKVLAWDENLKAKGEPSTITDPVLNKADLLETCDTAAILAMDIGG